MPVHPSNIFRPTEENLAAAAELIRGGRLVAFATETVYGLGADATNDRAVAAIFAAKGRPRFNPLIVHFTSARAALEAVEFDARASALAEAFWPGALTLVLKRRTASAISLLVSAGLDTIAVRVPAHAVAQALLRKVDRPLAAPSANRAGEVSPTSAAHVAASLDGKPAMILDGGPCPGGIESTVIDLALSSPVVLRPGGVEVEQIAAVIGPVGTANTAQSAGGSGVKSPGLVGRHYAPGRPLRLNATEVAEDEALLAFGPHRFTRFAAEMNLSPSRDLRDAAANLFAMLRALDRPEYSAIAVMPIPETGLGVAINDRLRRASQPDLTGPDPMG